jgi:hypothetical protein
MKKAMRLYTPVFAIAFCLCSAAVTAWADRDDWRQHSRDAREWHNGHWHNGHVVYENSDPYVTYAPPLVIEPPPPAYYAPQPGLSIVVPLHIR